MGSQGELEDGAMSLEYLASDACGRCGRDHCEVHCIKCNMMFHRGCVSRITTWTSSKGICDECYQKEISPQDDLNSTIKSMLRPSFDFQQVQSNSTVTVPVNVVEALQKRCDELEQKMRRMTMGPGQFPAPRMVAGSSNNARAMNCIPEETQGLESLGTVRREASQGVGPAVDQVRHTIELERGTAQRQSPGIRESMLSPFQSNRNISTSGSWTEKLSELNATFNLDETINVSKEQRAMRKTINHKLPSFNGDPQQWVPFITTLTRTTNACGFSDSENRDRLLNALQGDALRLVKDKLQHHGSMEVIISRLVQAFGQPAHLMKGMRKVVDKMHPLNDDLGNLAEFVGLVEDVEDVFKVTKRPSENSEILQQIEEQLPLYNRKKWLKRKRLSEDVDGRSLTGLVIYLNEVLNEAVEMGIIVTKRGQGSTAPVLVKEKTQSQPQRVLVIQEKCPVENDSHELVDCPTYTAGNGAVRWKLMKTHKRCVICLGGHFKNNCPKKKQTCGVNGCKGHHHNTLHFDKIQSPKATVATLINNPGNPVTFYCVVPIIIQHGDIVINSYAFLDGGASTSLISTNLARRLGVSGEKVQLPLQWADAKTTMILKSQKVNVLVRGVGLDAELFPMEAHTMDDLDLPTASVSHSILQEEELNVPMEFFDNAKPELLIGQDNMRLKRVLSSVLGKSGTIAATETPLGWYLEGQYRRVLTAARCNVMIAGHQIDDTLENVVSEYINAENYGLVDPDRVQLESDEDQLARNILAKETKFIEGRFQTGMLWKPNVRTLPDNRSLVLKRHQKFENQMTKTTGLWARVDDLMQNYLDKGYIRRIHEEEKKSIGNRTWYLNIFTVFNPMKPEKIRVVWDAAAKYYGMSLNDALMTGPDLTVPMVDVFMRFRAGRFAVTGDIQEMFLQIGIKEEDRSALRFFWRSHTSENFQVMEACRAIFGATCSPTQAQYVKNANANKWRDLFPEAADAIESCHYVDDYLQSSENEETLANLVLQVKDVHARGGFKIHKWFTNSTAVGNALGVSSLETVKEVTPNGNCSVLGLIWNTARDCFSFKLRREKMGEGLLHGRATPTKRDILRTTMSLYDPLGFIAHRLIELKLLVREAWRERLDWDEPLSTELTERWNRWGLRAKEIEDFQVPRWMGTGSGPVDMHVFCDASDCAIAAVGYVVDADSGNRALVFAKCRVASLKTKSIPRLELDAAVLGIKVRQIILKANPWRNIRSCTMWTDAQDVIYWLRSVQRKYSVYVANRVSTILAATEVSDWRWVKSEENPADMATKHLPKGKVDQLWWSGPSFLSSSPDQWPISCPEPKEVLELRPLAVIRMREELLIPDPARFSKWLVLIRASAMVHVAAAIFRKKRCKGDSQLTAEDEARGEMVVLQAIQRETEVHRLTKFSPFQDEKGLWRARGRTAKGDFPYEQKFPIILGNHHATRLLIAFYHELGGHQNYSRTVNEIRQRFLIPNIRALTNRVEKACMVCRIHRKQPRIPEMAALPRSRMAVGYPVFSYVGIDLFGPMEVIMLRRRLKRWGVLFTCLTTRAVYIEVVESLSTASCVMAIESFLTRRNLKPIEFISDNGTNFQGVARILRNGDGQLFKWTFNPAGCPHMGGAWERLIGAAKRALKRTDFSVINKDEDLRHALIKAERILNTRPLTEYPVDEDTQTCLTPQDILTGGSPVEPVDMDKFSPEGARRTRDAVIQAFWERWTHEYLPTLHVRPKWHKKEEPLEIGSLVYLCDSDHRVGWVRGVVDELWRDAESGQVRQVVVRTAAGKKYRRGAHYVSPLRVKK